MSRRSEFSDALKSFFGYGVKNADSADELNARTFLYYRTWALKKIFSRFNFGGMPTSWDVDYFLEHLFRDGYIAITDTAAGVLPLKCGFTGINIFEHPTEVIIANPVLGSFSRKIGVDAVLLHIQYDFAGVMPLVDKYAAMLTLCDSGIMVNVQNSKVAFIGFAESKAQAKTMERIYTDISAGVPAIYMKDTPTARDSFLFNRVKENYVAGDLELLKRQIKNDFLTEIGLDNANTEKRERMITDEVNANNGEVRESVQHWLDNIAAGLDEANALFALNLTVTLRDFSTKSTKLSTDETEGASDEV